MGIEVRKKKTFYKTLNTRVVNEKGLSFKSKGIMFYLLSKPTGWRGQLFNMSESSKDGIDSIKSAMKELVDAGYAKLRNHPTQQGKFSGKYYQITDTKNFFDEVV